MPTELDTVYKEQRDKRTSTLLGLPEGVATEEAHRAVADVERQVVNLPPETGLVPIQGPADEPKIQKPTPQDRPDVPLRALPTVQRAEFDEREFSLVENIKQFGTGVVTGTEGLAAGVGATIEAFGGFVSMIEEAADTPEGEGAGAFFEGIGADTRKMWQDEMQTTMLRDAQLWEGDFFENPSWQRAAGLMGAAAPSLLAAMTTAKVTGNTTAAAALLGMLEGMPMYAEAREAGQGRAFALAAAGLATASITFLEKVGLDEMMKGGRGWIGRFMAGGAAEGITEAAQTAVQNAIAHFGYDETRRLLEGIGDSLVAGAASGAPIAAMVGAKAIPGAVAEGATATDVIADALKKGIIDKPSHDIAQRLIALEEDVDGNLAVEIANVLKVASPEILEAQGIVPDAGQVFVVTGEHAPVINDGILQSTISLYKGADATTFVEEWYHRYLDNVQTSDPEAYDQILTLYTQAMEAGETRNTQEWFGHQGRDWFMAERPDSPMAAILQKAKRGILKLVGVIQNVPGANIDPLLLDHFQKAGGAKPMDAKAAGVAPDAQVEVEASQQVAGMSTGVGGWLSDVMGLETPGEITKAITAIYGDPDATIEIAGEKHRAGDLRQRYTIDVVSESYQVKPMRLKVQDGQLTIQDTLEKITANYDQWIAETVDQIENKVQATEEGGVLNLEHIDVNDETKALLAAGGFGIEAVEQLLSVARRTLTPEGVMKSALENPMSLKDVLALPPDAKINRETIFWVRFHHARVYDQFRQVIEAAQNPVDADTRQSLNDEIVKTGMLALAVHQKRLQIGHEAGASLQYFANNISGREIALENFHNLFSQVTTEGRGVTPETFVSMVDSLTSPEQIEHLIAGAQYPSWLEMIHEYWLFSILSGIKTQAVNVVSNTSFLGLNVMERQVAGMNPEQNVGVTEAAHMSWAMVTGMVDAFKAGATAVVTGQQQGTKAEDVNREPKISAKNIGGKMGIQDLETTTLGKGMDIFADWIIRGPFRGLGGGDAFFRSLAHRMQFRALALRQAKQNARADVGQDVANPKDVQQWFDDFMGNGGRVPTIEIATARQELMEQANDFATMVVFQSELGSIGEKFSSLANAHIGMRFLIPFVRTPSNILRETLKRTPLEGAALLDKDSSLRRAIQEGGAERDLAFARIALGGLVMATAVKLAQGGFVTGTPPEDFKRRRALERMGYQWHSVNVSALKRQDAAPKRGDFWMSYDRLDPIGALMGTAVDASYIMGTADTDDPLVFTQMPAALTLALSVNITSKTYLRGLGDFIDAMQQPNGYKATSYFKRQLTSFIPNILNQPGQAVDPYRRRAESITDAAKLRSGYFRSEVPRMQDRWGRFVEDNPLGFWGMFFPGYVKEAKPNPVDTEIVRVMDMGGDISGTDTGSFKNLYGVTLEPELREEFLGEAGNNAYDLLEATFKNSPKRFKSVLDAIVKEAVKGTVYADDTQGVSIESARQFVANYAMLDAKADTPEGKQYAGEQMATMIEKVLSLTTGLAKWNMAKNHEELWDARNAPVLSDLYVLEVEDGLRDALGVDIGTVREGMEQIMRSREEILR